MSKRDMRAKKLLLAVLLAMSMQSYYAAPTWAAEAGQQAEQTDIVDGKGQSDGTTTPAADEAETVKKADTKQEADEALTIMGYSVNTLNADDEYGVMPTIAAGGGDANPSTNAYTAGNASVSGSGLAVAIGYGAKATSAEWSVVLGADSETTAEYAVALGYSAKGSHKNSVAIGANSTTTAVDQVSFGKWDSTTSTWTTTRSLAGIKDIAMAGALTGVTTINGANFTVDKTNSNIAIGVLAKIVSGEQGVALGHEASVEGTGGVAVGSGAKTYDESGTALGFWAEAFRKDSIAIGSGAQGAGENSVAIGSNSKTIAADNSVAIGFAAHAADAINSIVIGTGSYTERDNQVNFGYYKLNADGRVDTMSTYYGRSLAGISSIDFIADEYGNKGAITGLTSINGVAVSGSAGTGLTVGGITLNNGGIMGEVTEYNYKMKINGIDLYTGISEEWDKGSMAFGKDAQIAAYTGATSFNATAIGTRAVADGDNAIAIGAYSTAYTEDDQPEGNTIAIGTNARAIAANSIAFGYQTYANQNTGNSMALGAYSSVDASDTVSFGHKNGDKYYDNINNDEKTYTDNLFRSLVNVKDLELNTADDGTGGAITGLTSINDVAVSGSAATGLTISGITLNNGGIMGKVTEDNYKMKINGLDLYTGINEEWDKGSMAFGKDSVIGNITGSTTFNAIAIGTGADAESDNAIALGAHSLAYTEDDMVGNAMAIGAYAGAYSSNSVAFGYQAYVARFDNSGDNNLINNSMALGTYSSVNTSDTVSFGHKVGDGYGDAYPSKTYTDNLFRSLVNVKDIELNTADDGTGGAITGLTKVNDVHFVIDKDNENVAISDEEPWSTSSVIIGIGAVATTNGTAIGNQAEALNVDSTAVGMTAKASGEVSVAVGVGAEAVGDTAIAIGGGANAGHSESVAIGYDSTTSAANQVAFGKMTDPATFRSLAGIKDITLTGAVNGVTLGVKGGTADDKDNVLVGGVDVTELGTNIGGIKRTGAGTDVSPYVTDIEGIKFSSGTLDLGGVWTESVETHPDDPDFTVTKYTSNGKGALNGVTSINGMNFVYDGYNSNIILGANVDTVGANTIAIGMDAVASGYEATLVGNNATASGAFSTALGYYASATKMEATAIGAFAEVAGEESVGVGSNSINRADQTIVIGTNANVMNADYKRSTVIGAYAASSAKDGIALGANAEVKHENSVAIGTESTTTAANQVSFGTGSIDGSGKTTWTTVRSLAGIKDIDLTGAVNGVTLGIKGGTAADKDNVLVGGVDVTKMQTDVAGKADKSTVDTLTANTAGISVVDDMTVIAKGFKVGATTYGMSSTGVLTAATVNGAAITSDSFNGVSIKSDGTVDGVDVSALKATVDGISTDGVGTADTAGIKRDTTGTATTKIEDNTSITTDGLTTNKVTVGNAILENGKLTVGAVTLTGGKLSGLTAGDITSAASTEAVTGGQVYTIKSDLETSISGKADTTTVTALDTRVGTAETNIGDLQTATADMATKTQVATDISTAKTELETAYNAADTVLSDRATALETATTGMTYASGTTTFAGVVTAGEFKVGVTGFGFNSEGVLTAKTVNGVTISGTDAAKDAAIGGYSLKTITDEIADLKTNGGATSANTVAISHAGTLGSADSLTTIEGNTKISSSGIVVTGTVEATTLKEGGTELAAKYAGISEAYTAEKAALKADKTDVDTLKTTVGDADTGLVKDMGDLQTATSALKAATTGMSYDSGTTSTSFSGNVVVGNVGNQTHTQITDNAIIFGQGAEKQVTVDASGIHVGAKAMNGISTFADSNGTHIDHTSLVTDTVTAANLNGVAISGNATDGLSVGGVNIKTLDDRLATLKTTVDDIQNSGVGTADMAGVQRSDADGDGINDTTTIETATSFTKAGMKTSNLEAATAAIGGVNFAAGGVVTGINSINGTVFSSDGKIGGVSLSGGKVNGIDIKWLDQRVTSLEGGGTGGGGTGGGGGANTSGIGKPDGDTTTIEGNTTVTGDGIETNKVTASDQIIVADGKDNQTVISEDGIKVAEGKTNEVTINDKGIHVGKNSSVMNDTEGFITDKGLYIGVNSSNDISTAKFSVDKGNGTMTSKVGGYTFTNGSSGAVFSHSGDTAYGTGSKLDTTIEGNKVTTGQLNADELWVGGNQVTVSGGTVNQTDAIDNQLTATKDGYDYTNGFTTTQTEGTTQSASKESVDGKEKLETVNKTTAGGTSVTTSKTSTNSADRKTEQSSSFVTNEGGMSLNTSTKVTDKDGNVTKNTSGETKMSGDSLTVSKTTVTSKDGKEETTTSSTTVGSGEVTLHREDGSTIRVGEAIEGMQGQIQDIGNKVNEMGVEIKEVGALSAALAGLHPQPQNANSRADFAMAMGSYEGKQALAVGGFYRPDKRTMLSIGASTTSSKHMMNMGISIALDKLPEAERNEQESNADLAERMKKLEADYEARLEKMEAAYEARMERLEARYARMKDAYEADKEQQKQQEAADETQETDEAASA
ncbi:YadA-like family protein [Phascolarctobacterium sp.]